MSPEELEEEALENEDDELLLVAADAWEEEGDIERAEVLRAGPFIRNETESFDPDATIAAVNRLASLSTRVLERSHDELLRRLNERGGRGVDLADEIDDIRRALAFRLYLSTRAAAKRRRR